MGILTRARESPRVNEAGGLEWYHGDKASFIIRQKYTDQSGYPVVLTSSSKVVILVTERGDEVYRKEFTEFPTPGDTGEQAVTWAIDDEVTEKLQPGKYQLRLIVHHGETVTTVVDSHIIVRR